MLLAALPGGTAAGSEVGIRLTWVPEETAVSRAFLRIRTGSGEIRSEGWQSVENGVVGVADLEASDEIEISTPRHAPCRLAARAGNAGCLLEALPVIRPFRRGGRIWCRASAKEAFRAVLPLSEEWGGGFALPRGPLDVVACAESGAATLFRGVRAEAIELPAPSGPGALQGQFVHPDGTAYSGAVSIAVETEGPAEGARGARIAWAEFFADVGIEVRRDGTFRLDPLPADALVLIARFPERPPIRIATKRRASGSVADAGRIVVERGGDLTIRLRNLTEEVPPDEPLGVELRSTRPDSGTGADAPPLLGSVSAAKPLLFRNMLPGSRRAALRWRDVKLGEREIDVLPGRTDEEWELVDRSIGGRVEDETGEAIAGATVRLENGLEKAVDTDDDGRFTLTFPHAGGRIPFSVKTGEEGRRLPHIVDPESAESLALTIQVPSRSLSVTILDAVTRKPIDGSYLNVEVVPRESPDGLSKSFSRREARDGHVRLSELPEGTVGFEANAPGYSRGEKQEVLLSKDARPAPVEILLHKAGRVTGFVVDPDGRPLPGARVAGPYGGNVQEVQSAADGSFELEIPAGQSSVVSAWSAPYRIGFVDLTPGAESVTIALQRRGPDSEAEIRLESGEPFGRAGWQLYLGIVPIDPYQLRDAFLGSGCAYVPGTSSDGILPLQGCLAEGVYSIGLTRVVDGKAMSVHTEPFRAGQTGVVRLRAWPIGSR